MSDLDNFSKPYAIVDGGYVVDSPENKKRTYNISGLVGDVVNKSHDIYSESRAKGYLDYLNIDNPDITTHVAQVALICLSLTEATDSLTANKKNHDFNYSGFDVGLADALYRLHLITGAEIDRCGDPLLKFIDAQWFKNHLENYKNRAMGNYNFFRRSTSRQYAILKLYNLVSEVIGNYRKSRTYEAVMKMIEAIVFIRLTGERERCTNIESIMKEKMESKFNISKNDAELAIHRKNLSNQY